MGLLELVLSWIVIASGSSNRRHHHHPPRLLAKLFQSLCHKMMILVRLILRLGSVEFVVKQTSTVKEKAGFGNSGEIKFARMNFFAWLCFSFGFFMANFRFPLLTRCLVSEN